MLVEKSSSVQEIELQNPDPGVHSRPQELNNLYLFLTTVLGLFLVVMISSPWSATTPTDQSRLALGTSAGVEDGCWSVPARRSPSRGSNSPEPPSPPHCFCTVRGAPLLRVLLVRIFFFWFIITGKSFPRLNLSSNLKCRPPRPDISELEWSVLENFISTKQDYH